MNPVRMTITFQNDLLGQEASFSLSTAPLPDPVANELAQRGLLACINSFAPHADLTTLEGWQEAAAAVHRGISLEYLRPRGINFARMTATAQASSQIEATLAAADAATTASLTLNGQPLLPAPPAEEPTE